MVQKERGARGGGDQKGGEPEWLADVCEQVQNNKGSRWGGYRGKRGKMYKQDEVDSSSETAEMATVHSMWVLCQPQTAITGPCFTNNKNK